MRLKLEKLREARNPAGTMGTTGTATICADPLGPSPFPFPRTVGTGARGGTNVFPMLHARGNRKSSVSMRLFPLFTRFPAKNTTQRSIGARIIHSQAIPRHGRTNCTSGPQPIVFSVIAHGVGLGRSMRIMWSGRTQPAKSLRQHSRHFAIGSRGRASLSQARCCMGWCLRRTSERFCRSLSGTVDRPKRTSQCERPF
jgi:hypothetical protein